MKQAAAKSALLAVITLSMPALADAASVTRINQYVGFGDSTLDSGYFRYHTTGDGVLDGLIAAAVASGDTGAFVANGVLNSIILAGKFGLSGAPIDAGGFNYANGGSYTMTDGQPYTASISAITQIRNYLASVNGAANPNALYMVKSGDNDLNFPAPPPNYLSDSASAVAAEVAVLQSAGARTILAPNSYNSALYAQSGGDIDPANAAKYATSVAYFSLRWADLQAAGVRFIPADIDSLFRYVVHNPTLFGFTASSVLVVNAPAYGNPPPYNSALLAYPLTAEQQQTFLFVDAHHLTTAGQTIEADYEYNLLVAPSQISLVVESAVQRGLARAATIQGQIDLSEQTRGPKGINVWASFGANSLSVENAPGFPNDSGAPFGGSAGIDFRTQCGVLLGAAFTAGTQTQSFTKGSGGYFDQTDEALSLYTAYQAGPVWGDAVATDGFLQDHIRRRVPLGILTDDNNASPDGHTLALALRAGGDIKLGNITTGPVGGVVMQKVYLDGFAETGSTGVTALTFASQTRDSMVGQLGWRVLADMGNWQPFGEMEWNHEWFDDGNTVTTSLNTVPAPSYTMDGAPIASDWATASIGTSYKLNSQVTLRGAFSTVFLSSQVASYGGELSMNISF